MQGIEPKFHSNLKERMEHYRWLIREIPDDPDMMSCDIISRTSELCELYEDYLNTKKKLEKSIQNYRQYNNDLRKALTIKMRDLKRKQKRK